MLIPRSCFLGEDPFQAIWHSIFYSISAFNNAGFTPHSDGIVPYGHDLSCSCPSALPCSWVRLVSPVFIAIQRRPPSALTLAELTAN